MRIGLLNSVFNPIHNGHLALADEARTQYKLDEVWFIPIKDSCSEDNKSNIISADDRAFLVEKSIEDVEWAEIHYEEMQHENTTDIIRAYKEQYPQHNFYLIMGADELCSILNWHEGEWIIKNCKIIAAIRDNPIEYENFYNWKYNLNKFYSGNIFSLRFYNRLSSSDIRKKIVMNHSYRFDVPYPVYQYVEKFHPYKGNL